MKRWKMENWQKRGRNKRRIEMSRNREEEEEGRKKKKKMKMEKQKESKRTFDVADLTFSWFYAHASTSGELRTVGAISSDGKGL
ncbi:hypothetical protein ANN_12514 [Periplaneta americana]|uniref:Uncharacterized protein n=1 Tax=Periplaneta americana TaxID=6978 RepID=A0ABQ8THC6_PERAM|nr:hypothetical protein ANN_12514 [Periplaneta americana]